MVPNVLAFAFWNKVQNFTGEERAYMALSGLVGKFSKKDYFSSIMISKIMGQKSGFDNEQNVIDMIFKITNDKIISEKICRDGYYGLCHNFGLKRWIEGF